MFREDGNVLHFSAPKGTRPAPHPSHGTTSPTLWCYCKIRLAAHVLTHFISVVHAAVTANTFAVYGTGQVKELTELVPGILNQLGPDSLASLRKLAESYQAIQQNQQRPPNAADDEDDDDVPDLVENFDAVEDKPADKSELEELN